MATLITRSPLQRQQKRCCHHCRIPFLLSFPNSVIGKDTDGGSVCSSCRNVAPPICHQWSAAQEVQQLTRKLQEQGEQLRSSERSVKQVQVQLVTKAQADSTVHRDLTQLKVRRNSCFRNNPLLPRETPPPPCWAPWPPPRLSCPIALVSAVMMQLKKHKRMLVFKNPLLRECCNLLQAQVCRSESRGGLGNFHFHTDNVNTCRS